MADEPPELLPEDPESDEPEPEPDEDDDPESEEPEVAEEPAGVVDEELPRLSFL